ncbi:MAG TPA: tetratricopeptide repeat protein [Anaeromyxobacteraceae bacterium]|nr:tetratricopeptide repeat protein [Anaeromyxobacteraceae bacterium]
MHRVLIVETHAPTSEYLCRTISEAGFETIPTLGEAAWETFAARRPALVVIASDLPSAAALAARLRDADGHVLVVVADREHLGRARGREACLPIKANAYVADPTRKEMVEKLRQLVAQASQGKPRLRGVPLVLSRPPSAQGEVKPGVVPRLLHQIWRAMSEGVLVLADAGSEERIFFLRGVPVAYDSDDPADSLLRRLFEAGRMDDATHQAALEAQASGLSPGAALIAAGVLEPGEPLTAALRAHVKAMTIRATGLKRGRWRFHDGNEFAGQVQPAEILPLQAILEGARLHMPVKHFSDALKQVSEAYPVRTGDFQQLLPACALGSVDLRLALALDGRTPTHAFLEARKGELKEALGLLWFLSMIGAVAFHEAPAEGADADRYGATPPRRRKPLPPDRAEAIRQAALQIVPGTHLHALGVDISATTDDVERAYTEVASRFHPDGFVEYEVGDLEDLLTAIQAKLSAAYRVLGNEEKRRGYLAFLLLQFELSGARRPGIDLDAEISLKRGEKALRAHRFAEAVNAFRDAVERNPKEPEYLAMLGFASLYDPVLPAGQRADEARRAAKRALAITPDHPRALSVLALAEERRGNVSDARRLVLDALRAHPDHEVAKAVLHRLNTLRK